MGNLTSTLTLRLIDQISGPAKKVEGSLKNLDSKARGAVGRRGGGGGIVAGMGGRMASIATAAAGYGAVRGVSRAVQEYAEADRALTRVRITAEASTAEMERAGLALQALAQAVALPREDLVKGLDVLVQAGFNLQEAMAFLPSVAATAQATGAQVEDVGRSAAAMATSLKVEAAAMGRSFDALAVSGKIGMFEIKDMSQHLPRVLASAAKLGFAGADGVERIGVMLQISKKVSGTAESAAVGVADAFEKILSPTVLKAAQKHNLDLLKIMEVAQKRGENGAEAIVQALMKATKNMNDLRRNAFLSSIFAESDSRRFIVAMIEHWEEYRSAVARVKAANGTIAGDLAKVTGDAEASIQRLSNAWNAFLVSSGKLAYYAGAGGFLEDLNLAIRALSEGLKQANDAAEDLFGAGPGKAWDDNVRKPARAKIERMEAERVDPFRKKERQAQEDLDALDAELGKKRKTLAANPVGRLFIAEQIKALEQQRREAADRRDLYRGFTAPGVEPVRNGDLPGGGGAMGMGTVEGAARMDAAALAAGDAGAAAMQAFAAGIERQASVALAAADRFIADLRARLSVTISPTIAPNYVAPGGGVAPAPAAPGKQSRALTGSDARRIVRFEGDRMYRSTGLA